MLIGLTPTLPQGEKAKSRLSGRLKLRTEGVE